MLHDNAYPHVACTVQDTSTLHACWTTPPYRLDLSSCDFHEFDPLKEAIRGCILGFDKVVKDMVAQWFQQQRREFFVRVSIS